MGVSSKLTGWSTTVIGGDWIGLDQTEAECVALAQKLKYAKQIRLEFT